MGTTLRCGVGGCSEQVNPLGYCNLHPLYCHCTQPEPDAWRMCTRCKRKPASLMKQSASGGAVTGPSFLIREGDCTLVLPKRAAS